MKKILLTSTIVASLGVTYAGVAFAQEAPKAVSEAKKDTKKAEEANKVSEIVITGSRIRRSDYNSPSPITVVTNEAAQLAGTASGAELLQGLTQSSVTQQTNGLLGGYVVEGGPGVQTLSLRGLGAQRSLFLLNGRRLGPAGVGGTVGPVDLSVLPDMALNRIEILKDGSSSIYGSDAVAGVVNYLTKKDTDGFRFSAYTQIPERSGGETYNASLAWGKTFEKGYLSIAASYADNQGLVRKDRKDTNCTQDYYFDLKTGQRADLLGADGKPKCFNLYSNAIQSKQYFGGSFQYDPTLSNYANYPAAALNLRKFLPNWVRAGRYGNPATFPYSNQDDPRTGDITVITPRRTSTVFATGGYDLSSNVSAYGELLLNQRRTSNFGLYQLFPTISENNPNNTLAAGLIAASGGAANGQIVPIIARENRTSQDVKYIHAVAGLTGTINGLGFLNGFKWDAYYQFSGNHGEYLNTFVYKDRVIAAAGIDDSGADVSKGLACNPAVLKSTSTCTAIAWTDPRVLSGNFNAAEKAYLFGVEKGTTDYYQHAVEASVNGDLFTLPAGKVSAAGGIYLRRDEIKDTPGSQAQARNYWGFTTAGVTKGSETVKEVYGELGIPVLKNTFLAKSLNLSVSGRYSDYESFGSNSTYKVALDWALTPEYRIRGSYGTSFRAPSLYERFLADQTSYSSLTDPCTKWGDSTNQILRTRCAADGLPDTYAGYAASPLVLSGGGKKLKPETSDAYSFGVVWSPSFANLKLALDYFDFNVKDEVAQFGAASIVNSCYTALRGNTVFCGLFKRDAVTKDITVINDNYLNIAEQNNRGLDLGINYTHNFRAGRLSIESNTTWVFRNSSSLNGTVTTDYTGGQGNPRVINNTSASFTFGDYTAYWRVDMTGKTSDIRFVDNGGVVTNNLTFPNGYYRKMGTEFTAYHTLSLSKRMDKMTIRGGVQNLFDERAPSVSSGEFRVGTAALNNFDLLGRRFFFRVERNF